MSKQLLHQSIETHTVAAGRMTAWWLGGSGFVIKNSGGNILLVDPYLSNSVEGIFGLRRAFPVPLDPAALRPTVVVSTHWHEDHLDPGTIPVIAEHSPQTLFAMPPGAACHAVSWGVKRTRIHHLTSTERWDVAGFFIRHVPARHDAGIAGWESPDAMGVLIGTADATFYHTGDTEYDSRILRCVTHPPTLATACINGVTGNMNAHEAALLLWQMRAGIVVPHHHLLWDSDPSGGVATLNPELFENTYRRLGGTGKVHLPLVGEPIAI